MSRQSSSQRITGSLPGGFVHKYIFETDLTLHLSSRKAELCVREQEYLSKSRRS